MPHRLSAFGMVAAVCCVFFGGPAVAAAQEPGNLVDVRWLEQRLQDPAIVLLDASPAPMYAAGHIPGAINVDAMVYGGKESPLAETERLYQSWGVSAGKRIVMYDQGGTFMATRLLFALLHHGFDERNLLILDGGMAKWQAAGLPVTKEPTTAPKPGTFRVTHVNETVRVRLPEFLAATGDPSANALVEALDANWHFGEIRPFNRAGHPPFGILWPSADLFNADKTFKSPDELRRMTRYLGIRPEQQIHTYCGGGVAASAPFFALRFILGYPRVKLYTESEMGWLSDPRDLPYWTYDAPYLMRDSAWLQWVNSQMLRTYLGAQVNIIDVRTPDAYAQGHVPFALNVPADAFRRHLANPVALAETLAAAGVDSSLEAVVVSGGGLTPDAALAWLMLEKLGQAKASVLVDSMDRWAQQGLQVTKAATAVGPRKGPADTTIEPKPYRPKPADGVIIASPAATTGVYPKVFVASGAQMPSAAPQGTVVHVTYSSLLNADGTPKAAKDIWNILAKAGVPRYAELVCVADDPGESAANYFILKLMGFPDVKVLAR